MRHARDIHYALLGVVSQNPAGVHGYALKRQCDRILGHFWQLNFGEVYRVLGEAATSRKIFRITDKGRRSLDTFIGFSCGSEMAGTESRRAPSAASFTPLF